MIERIIAHLDTLAPAFARRDTMVWFILFVIGMTIRRDVAGVTSMVRALGIQPSGYDAFLNMLEGRSIKLPTLVHEWISLVFDLHKDTLVRVNNRIVLLGDGLKIGKEAQRMPGVKRLHQESSNNSKPEYIMGHSFQVLSVLVGNNNQAAFATPLTSRIHEGIKLTPRDKKTLQQKFCDLLKTINLAGSAYLVIDSYYSCGYFMKFCVEKMNTHVVTRADSSVVAYEKPEEQPSIKKGRGRPKKYGDKIKLKNYFPTQPSQTATLSLYGKEEVTVTYWTKDLIWRSYGGLMRFVGVKFPGKEMIILMTTDLTLEVQDIIKLYSFRMKIDVSFKPAVHTVGTYSYHNWTSAMPKIKRGDGNQYLHRTKPEDRTRIMTKLRECEIHVACGNIAQGLLQYLAVHQADSVWNSFKGWIRTIRPNLPPSEAVVIAALQQEYLKYLLTLTGGSDLEKKLIEILDQQQLDGIGVLQKQA